MQTIQLERKIAAPIERCFLLSLSIDLHVESASQTSERAIAGVTHGIIGLGESVTWRGKHFGLMLTQTSKITACERPTYFQDTMTEGLFRSFVHDHFFTEDSDGTTTMRDVLRFEAPFGLLGRCVERLLLRSYLQQFLQERNAAICEAAQSQSEWEKYLAPL